MDNHTRKGLFLKQVRESKGISLEVIHESTKIPLDALKAIEQGYTIRTLSPFYYRGFLKIYAQYLGVNIAEVVDDYKPEKLPVHIVEKKEKYDSVEIKVNPVLTSEMKNLIIKILIGVVALLVVVKIVSVLLHHKPSRGERVDVKVQRVNEKIKAVKLKPLPTVEKKIILEEKTTPKETSRASQAQTAAVSIAASKSAAGEKEAAKRTDLVVRAKKDSWVQVKVDDAVVFRSVLKKGAVETWHAKNTIELSGKDISDLEYELNGKIIGPLGKENRRAKKVVIDRNGFSVKQ